MVIFTFGREHERKCEARYVRNPAQVPLILAVVDAVHDLIEGQASESDLRSVLREAFIEGGSGVWENAEKWLRKCSSDYPGLLDLWVEFAANSKLEVRFRVACVLDRVPKNIFDSLSVQLSNDKSRKVSSMARARIEDVCSRNAT
jgi:hypothetical protein